MKQDRLKPTLPMLHFEIATCCPSLFGKLQKRKLSLPQKNSSLMNRCVWRASPSFLRSPWCDRDRGGKTLFPPGPPVASSGLAKRGLIPHKSQESRSKVRARPVILEKAETPGNSVGVYLPSELLKVRCAAWSTPWIRSSLTFATTAGSPA